MTSQAILDAYCQQFGMTRRQLFDADFKRHELINADFDTFFADKEQTEENLRFWYEQSETMPLGILHCAMSEIATGQAEWVQERIRRHNKLLVLDYGCGLSVAVGPLADKPFIITLADVNGLHMSLVRQLYGADGWGATTCVRSLPLTGVEPRHFDCVVCQEVFEHTVDPIATLKTVLDLVANDGIAILSWTLGGWYGNHTHLSRHIGQVDDAAILGALTDWGWQETASHSNRLGEWRRTA